MRKNKKYPFNNQTFTVLTLKKKHQYLHFQIITFGHQIRVFFFLAQVYKSASALPNKIQTKKKKKEFRIRFP